MRLALVATAACLLGSAEAQSVLLTVHGPPNKDLGSSLVNCGDIDGDGHADLFSGNADGGFSSYFALVLSGKTGALVHEFDTPTPGIHFGAAVAGGQDITGDGVPDLLVAANYGDPGHPYPASMGTGSVFVYSGASFTLVRTHVGAQGAFLGSVLGFLDDVNGDGVADYAATAGHLDPVVGGGSGISQVFIWSGATGALIDTKTSPAPLNAFGAGLLTVGDVDLDGSLDYAIGARLADSAGLTNNGSVSLYSGAGGALLRTDHGLANNELMGEGLTATGDVDQDGTADYASTYLHLTNRTRVISGATGAVVSDISSPLMDFPYFETNQLQSVEDWNGNGVRELVIANAGKDQSHILVADAKTGEPLYLIIDDGTATPLPGLTAVLDDLDGDGHSEIVASAVGPSIGVAAFEFTTVPLAASAHELPVAGGAAVQFSLSPGAKYAGATCFLAASASGTAPGFHVGHVQVPLNYDAFTVLSIALADVAPFSGTFGTLDPINGTGHAAFDMTAFAFPPAAAGLTLSFAYVVRSLDSLGNLSWTFASNPVDVAITP